MFLMLRFLFNLAKILDGHNTFSDILNNSMNLFKKVMGTLKWVTSQQHF